MARHSAASRPTMPRALAVSVTVLLRASAPGGGPDQAGRAHRGHLLARRRVGALHRRGQLGDRHRAARVQPDQLHHEARLEPADLRLGVDPGDVGVHRGLQQAQRPPVALLGRVGGASSHPDIGLNCNSTCISAVTTWQTSYCPWTRYARRSRYAGRRGRREERDRATKAGLLADISPLRESAPFRRLWAGTTLSSVGSSMTSFAVPLQVYDITRSPFAVGAIGVAQVVPTLAIGLLGGSLADARRPAQARAGHQQRPGRRVGRARRAVLRRAAPGLAAVRARRGAVRARRDQRARPAAPSSRSLLPPGQLAAGLALNRLSFQIMLTAGPALAGLITAAPHLGLRAATSSTRSASRRRCTGSARLPALRPQAGAARPGPRAVADGSPLHRPQPGARRRVPRRPERDRLRPAGRAVPGDQRRAVRRRPPHARPVHRGHRRRRPGQRGAVRAGQARSRARAGPCSSRSPSGARPSPASRSPPACG